MHYTNRRILYFTLLYSRSSFIDLFRTCARSRDRQELFIYPLTPSIVSTLGVSSVSLPLPSLVLPATHKPNEPYLPLYYSHIATKLIPILRLSHLYLATRLERAQQTPDHIAYTALCISVVRQKQSNEIVGKRRWTRTDAIHANVTGCMPIQQEHSGILGNAMLPGCLVMTTAADGGTYIS